MTLLLWTWKVRVNQQWLPRRQLCTPWGTHRTRGWTLPMNTVVINAFISNPESITRFPEISKRVGSHLDKAALHNKNLFTSWHSPFSTSVGKMIFPNSFAICDGRAARISSKWVKLFKRKMRIVSGIFNRSAVPLSELKSITSRGYHTIAIVTLGK